MRTLAVFCLIGACALIRVCGQHSHINAGAIDLAEGSKLRFVNGANFVAESGFVLNLAPGAEDTPYEGLYQGAITFTALPATVHTGGPAPGHALLGTFIEAQLVSLEGPAGGEFSIWQENEEFGTATKIATVRAGVTNGTEMVSLSENDRSPGSDPYGHIHGRRFSLNKPGLYTLGVQLVDTAGNGSNNGPLHAPSDLFRMQLQAGVTIASIHREESGLAIRFAAAPGSLYQLEATSELRGAETVWTPVGDPHEGFNLLHLVIDPEATLSRRFYRLKLTAIEE